MAAVVACCRRCGVGALGGAWLGDRGRGFGAWRGGSHLSDVDRKSAEARLPCGRARAAQRRQPSLAEVRVAADGRLAAKSLADPLAGEDRRRHRASGGRGGSAGTGAGGRARHHALCHGCRRRLALGSLACVERAEFTSAPDADWQRWVSTKFETGIASDPRPVRCRAKGWRGSGDGPWHAPIGRESSCSGGPAAVRRRRWASRWCSTNSAQQRAACAPKAGGLRARGPRRGCHAACRRHFGLNPIACSTAAARS